MSENTDHIPDPGTDREAFQAWAILYLDRALELKDELAFERKLIESPEAALAFRQAAEMDASLFEAAASAALSVASGPVKRRKPKTTASIPKVTRIPTLQSAEAEALDPRNQDDMQFVTTVCTDIASQQELDRHKSQRTDRITRGWRRHWLQGFVAAGVVAALTLVFVNQLLPQGPERGTAQHHRRAHGVNEAKGAQDETLEALPVETQPGEQVVENNGDSFREAPITGLVPPEQVAPPETLAHSTEVPAPEKSPKDADLVPTAAIGKTPQRSIPVPESVAPIQPGSVDPADAERMNDGLVWLPLGSVKVERDTASASIAFTRDENAFTRDEKVFGGLLYTRALDPQRMPSLKVSIDAPLFTSPQMDFQFVLFNRIQGKRVAVSLKSFEALIKDSVNLKERKHTLEIVVRKFNQFEICIDGVAVNHTEPLLQAEWEKLYIGFMVSARGSDTETVSIERVSLGGVVGVGGVGDK